MKDEDLLPLLVAHLGLKPRRDDTVIYPKTGHFTDLQRYRDLAAALVAQERMRARTVVRQMLAEMDDGRSHSARCDMSGLCTCAKQEALAEGRQYLNSQDGTE